MWFEGDVVGRILMATALGAVIGLEREAADQPAGLRTHIAVSVGAALFGVISTLGFEEFNAPRETTNVQVDVTRVASQVVVAVGFLGAGMIFRQGATVRNLTTAASIWVTCAVGLAAGVGDFWAATFTTAITLVTLLLLRPIRALVRRWLARDARRLRIVLAPDAKPAPVVSALSALEGVELDALSIEKDRGAYVVVAEVHSPPHVDLNEQLAVVATRDDVDTLSDD